MNATVCSTAEPIKGTDLPLAQVPCLTYKCETALRRKGLWPSCTSASRKRRKGPPSPQPSTSTQASARQKEKGSCNQPHVPHPRPRAVSDMQRHASGHS